MPPQMPEFKLIMNRVILQSGISKCQAISATDREIRQTETKPGLFAHTEVLMSNQVARAIDFVFFDIGGTLGDLGSHGKLIPRPAAPPIQYLVSGPLQPLWISRSVAPKLRSAARSCASFRRTVVSAPQVAAVCSDGWPGGSGHRLCRSN